MTTVISVQNVSKKYLIDRERNTNYETFADRFTQFGKRLLKPGTSGDRQMKEEFWALRDASFDVKQGDRVGIIGRNGAGKSTLLKILSRITEPTSGQIGIKGRVASLLEVGTGFHAELTGRENIYLNGAILGMSRKDIRQRFDEIVDFAEVEQFLDTPVKRYSTGMYIRLAFAVAAHLEPEILIVDEVLAVGDAQFQKKCLGKMGEVGQQGRTVLFVSHNIAAVSKLCSRGILISGGAIVDAGEVQRCIDGYLGSVSSGDFECGVDKQKLSLCVGGGFKIVDVMCRNLSSSSAVITSGDDVELKLHYKYSGSNPVPSLVISIKDLNGVEIIRLSNLPISGVHLSLQPSGKIALVIRRLSLVKGSYLIDIGFARAGIEMIFYQESVIRLDVAGADIYGSGLQLDNSRGLVWVDHEWSSVA